MTRIGIMQGRLVPPAENRIQSFPRNDWAAEFPRAMQAGLDCIEWIFEGYGMEVNPLVTDEGPSEIKALSLKHGVHVLSLCADYFMEKPLVRTSADELEERLSTLSRLTRRCRLLGMNRIVLPFVDASRIDTDEDADHVTMALERALPVAEETGVEFHLETSLSPARFAELLNRLPHPLLKVNYDSGNSASLGYDPRAEFAAYGPRIGSVHIKDRVRGGGTVPLGTGDTDFDALFGCLKEMGYSGDYILQVARSAAGDEVAWAGRNREFVLGYLSRTR